MSGRGGRVGRVGVYNLNFAAKGGGEKRSLILASHLSRTCEVLLLSFHALDLASLESYFDVDLARVIPVALGADAQDGEAIGALGLDLFVNNSYLSELPCPAPRGVYMCMFPHELASPAALETYGGVTAHARFTRAWIRQRWKRNAALVYSPCDAIAPAASKDRMILHVGRFGDDSAREHHKRQDVLVESFRRMSGLHDAGWELHLAGSLAPDGAGRAALENLRVLAEGLPVRFHPDAPRILIRDLYARASIYWHATGFGASPEACPSRQEHFGVAVVEAMSAGAVPVVFDAAGPRETVRSGRTGFLYRDVEGLIEHTRGLFRDGALRRRMAARAVVASRRFSREAFVSRVERVMENA